MLLAREPFTASSNRRTVAVTVVGAAVFFGLAAFRHAMFQSSAYDLGWFDQAVYLISRGLPPVVSPAGYHILGDHAAVVLYPVALLYLIVPSPYWLLALQALALAAGASLAALAARREGLPDTVAAAVALAFLLYPQIFNADLFDFHPEVFATAALLAAVLAAWERRPVAFAVAVAVALACKEVVALTVVAMGLWLALGERRPRYGLAAAGAAAAWFAVAAGWIVPRLSGGSVAALSRYDALGATPAEIVSTVLHHPVDVIAGAADVAAFWYLAALIVPLLWGLGRRGGTALLVAVPVVVLNLLADYPKQRSLIYHYSLVAVPFLFVAAVRGLAARRRALRRPWLVAAVAVLGFAAWSDAPKYVRHVTDRADTAAAVSAAATLIPADAAVLTTEAIAPHLAHRRVIRITEKGNPKQVSGFGAILLDLRHPGWRSDRAHAEAVARAAREDPGLVSLPTLDDDVLLFLRRGELP